MLFNDGSNEFGYIIIHILWPIICTLPGNTIFSNILYTKVSFVKTI